MGFIGVISPRNKWSYSVIIKNYLGGGFKDFLFSPLLGEDSNFG